MTPAPDKPSDTPRTQGVNEFIQKRLYIATEGSGIVTHQQHSEVLSYINRIERELSAQTEALARVTRERDEARKDSERRLKFIQQCSGRVLARIHLKAACDHDNEFEGFKIEIDRAIDAPRQETP